MQSDSQASLGRNIDDPTGAGFVGRGYYSFGVASSFCFGFDDLSLRDYTAAANPSGCCCGHEPD